MGRAYVYIMTNKPMGILYIGVTADLPARIFMHRSGTGSDFCKKWDLTRLVYAEPFGRIDEAIVREKALKKWKRGWKLRLISEANPEWADLFEHING
ncbi:excinuclease ABC subunit C [Sphingopyxis sp. H038]|nr:excinuclease ABC subunit C [Sphingopyxis sp. H012]KTE10055.1 excinuclease ABC subunit C [Sphingopyxis sp. H053]KTE15450.1 excinuclease ABC subunit C [Sphingopyxis sp. H093]KTE26220.1 excinuclease ABC subunit C [Sphingopyxis sp. H080]KTE33724.1 excinuclease ABC subunit C [Sphingopyxis sp. H038]KTE41626.1 excinuclease ABC subunit C [Sphingopyxis sp. H077]KTE43547.1 excinuclease ABC subunit C [Sphingopyxis sp. H005]KTE70405.1 excinuclease ABC subunit C [Sphingopyxis sp. H085]